MSDFLSNFSPDNYDGKEKPTPDREKKTSVTESFGSPSTNTDD